MGKVFDGLDAKLTDWIGRQALFFVGTAPSGDGGHVNVSPKGPIGSFRVLGPRRVAYLDLIGSGAETAAHLRENGRIVVMFCAFDGPPRILRLHGRGELHQLGEPAFGELFDSLGFAAVETAGDAARAIVTVDVERIADSCGYGVPRLDLVGVRPQYPAWVAGKLRAGPGGLLDYVDEKNAASIDGLPAIDPELLPR